MQTSIPLEKLVQAFNIILKSADPQKVRQKYQSWDLNALKRNIKKQKCQNSSIILNSLSQLCNCSFCLNNPKEFTLNCGHSYCNSCLLQTLQPNEKSEALCKIDECMEELIYDDYERLLKSTFIYKNYELNQCLLGKIKSIDKSVCYYCQICSNQTEFLNYVEDGVCLCTKCCFNHIHSIPASASDPVHNTKFTLPPGLPSIKSILQSKRFKCSSCDIVYEFSLLFFPCACCPNEGYCLSCYIEIIPTLDCPKCLGPINSFLLKSILRIG